MSGNQNKGRAFTYTQPYEETHVSADLSAMAMLFIEAMCQQQEQNKSYGELIRTKNALNQFGFKNSHNAKLIGSMDEQIEAYSKATDTLAFMEQVWEKFGTDAMVVRYDHFFQILEKYDMVCGSFDRYAGGIPQEVLDTLTRLNDMWERKELDMTYAAPFEWAHEFEISDEEFVVSGLIDFLRMPIKTTKVNDKINSAVGLEDGELSVFPDTNKLSDVLFISAPAADMMPLEITVEFDTDKLRELRNAEPQSEEAFRMARDRYFHDDVYDMSYYRIASIRNDEITKINQAVKDEEKRLQDIIAASDINRYAKIEFISKEPQIVRILKDPFICSLTPYGVLIHAKWGAEAEDATIKRYEQLRDAIIGKGGAV